ncbi:hypothetical protein BDK51DRAFT_44880 [Blyttiomyces helicus]|uniref:Uncharacterized protein n=1 Tax=Blyttiomyces helicus TaxID=388810 RepID=A0A4P9VUP4_9FUNG|nr:hypothetical protein BDK51DRAFT_44880 [Blyttiomyces helicus]|eukprot:RKO82822.1 hypothetical protein BDK51DRAFT_44880 [Blyttiomyces helicus]
MCTGSYAMQASLAGLPGAPRPHQRTAPPPSSPPRHRRRAARSIWTAPKLNPTAVASSSWTPPAEEPTHPSPLSLLPRRYPISRAFRLTSSGNPAVGTHVMVFGIEKGRDREGADEGCKDAGVRRRRISHNEKGTCSLHISCLLPGLNRRPLDLQSNALPTELRRLHGKSPFLTVFDAPTALAAWLLIFAGGFYTRGLGNETNGGKHSTGQNLINGDKKPPATYSMNCSRAFGRGQDGKCRDHVPHPAKEKTLQEWRLPPLPLYTSSATQQTSDCVLWPPGPDLIDL